MFCKKCRKVIDENSAFCKYCGGKIKISKNDSAKNLKKECIHNALCNYMIKTNIISGLDPNFGEFETYEESESGEIYVELVATTKNILIQNKQTRYGAVIKEIDKNGVCVFQSPGPQIINNITPTKIVKKTLKFKDL